MVSLCALINLQTGNFPDKLFECGTRHSENQILSFCNISSYAVHAHQLFPLDRRFVNIMSPKQGSYFSVMTKFHDISRIFHKFPGIIFYFFNVVHTSFDSCISLVDRDSDLKSTEPWFSSFERNIPRPPIHCLRSNEWNLPTALLRTI